MQLYRGSNIQINLGALFIAALIIWTAIDCSDGPMADYLHGKVSFGTYAAYFAVALLIGLMFLRRSVRRSTAPLEPRIIWRPFELGMVFFFGSGLLVMVIGAATGFADTKDISTVVKVVLSGADYSRLARFPFSNRGLGRVCFRFVEGPGQEVEIERAEKALGRLPMYRPELS